MFSAPETRRARSRPRNPAANPLAPAEPAHPGTAVMSSMTVSVPFDDLLDLLLFRRKESGLHQSNFSGTPGRRRHVRARRRSPAWRRSRTWASAAVLLRLRRRLRVLPSRSRQLSKALRPGCCMPCLSTPMPADRAAESVNHCLSVCESLTLTVRMGRSVSGSDACPQVLPDRPPPCRRQVSNPRAPSLRCGCWVLWRSAW
jgi:hypothetical protein